MTPYTPTASQLASSPALVPAAPRLLSLDVFRGSDIILMFIVNMSYDPTIPQWFGHAGWNQGRHGQWLADYVFPWFLFIVGVAIPFSMNSGRGKNLSAAAKLLSAFKRGTIIYLLGILIWICKSAPDSLDKPGSPIRLETFKHWDILPLIGWGYFAAVAIYCLPRAVRVWASAAFALAVLVAKWAVMPDLTATVGLDRAAWVSARTDTEHAIRAWGWWGTLVTQGLPAAATVVFGVLAGELLRADASPARKFATLFLAGVAATAAAVAWAGPGGFPVSKDFFTSTYVLLSAGTGAMLLALCYLLIDARPGPPRRVFRAVTLIPEAYGKNALAVYIAAELTWALAWTRWRLITPWGDGQHLWPASKAWLKHWTTDAAGAWLAIAGYVLIYAALALWLHRKKVYIKV